MQNDNPNDPYNGYESATDSEPPLVGGGQGRASYDPEPGAGLSIFLAVAWTGVAIAFAYFLFAAGVLWEGGEL